MAKRTDLQLSEIIETLANHPEGLTRGEVSKHLSFSLNDKTLQRRLRTLTEAHRIRKEGERKATKYFPQELT